MDDRIKPTPFDWSAVPPPRSAGKGFRYEPSNNTMVLNWGGGDYDVILDEIEQPIDIVETITHLGRKDWEGMTPAALGELANELAKHKGWHRGLL